MNARDMVLEEASKVRGYTLSLIDAVDFGDWFRFPQEGVTHVAWQVGHLAVCQYALTMRRVRGELDGDEDLMPKQYFELFGKGSEPSDDSGKYPSPAELRRVLDAVHNAAMGELKDVSEEVLSQESSPAHPMFSTKFGALQWSVQHEMLHAGQIGMLRRLFGNAPLR